VSPDKSASIHQPDAGQAVVRAGRTRPARWSHVNTMASSMCEGKEGGMAHPAHGGMSASGKSRPSCMLRTSEACEGQHIHSSTMHQRRTLSMRQQLMSFLTSSSEDKSAPLVRVHPALTTLSHPSSRQRHCIL